MRLSCVSCVAVLFSTVAVATTNSTPQALNTTNHNLVQQAPGGPVLYYNGSGDVPSYYDTSPDPTPITPLNSSTTTVSQYYQQVLNIINGTSVTNNCTQCIDSAIVLHSAAASLQVDDFVELLIDICEASTAVQKSLYAVNCRSQFGSVANNSIPYSSGGAGNGAYYAQLFAFMSNDTLDMQTYCHFNWGVCPTPPVVGIDESLYFSPKPNSSYTAPPPSGSSMNVLHLSDWHLDPRYDIGSEANCSQYLCCRPYATNTKLNTNVQNASVPASRFGYLYCDAPPDLALSAFSTMPQFFNLSKVTFAIFTGDIVSHDDDDQLSQAYVSYEEEVTYRTFKAWLGNIPLYATLGNHDSFPEAYNTPNSINPNPKNGSTNAMSWNYQLQTSLWHNFTWINDTETQYAATHYAAYAHTTAQGLRVISLNTDFWYRDNIFNYFDTQNPDSSGMLKWLANELTACEAQGQRAWIIGHVLSGYDGSNPLPNPTALFYSIVRRFSPTTIAGIFFGHTHEDQLQIFYDYLPNSTYVKNGTTLRNTTMVDYSKPLQMGFIGPSITPLTGNNAGYQMYQVDAKTFSVTGIQTYFANVSEANTWTTPVWQFEYDARSTYGAAAANGTGMSWPTTAPLNATFWDGVTKAMLTNQTLVEMYNLYETKSSVVTKNCTSMACAKQKVCYIRSGSAALGLACGSGNGPF